MNPPVSTSKPTFMLYPEPRSCGFALTFNNSVTVSVRWGTMNYSDGCTTAECAAFLGHGFIHVPGFMYGSDDVLSHLSSDQVAQFIETAARLDTPEDFLP